MQDIKFSQFDVEQAILAATGILQKELVPLLREERKTEALVLASNIKIALLKCDMEDGVERSNIGRIFNDLKLGVISLVERMIVIPSRSLIKDIFILLNNSFFQETGIAV